MYTKLHSVSFVINEYIVYPNSAWRMTFSTCGLDRQDMHEKIYIPSMSNSQLISYLLQWAVYDGSYNRDSHIIHKCQTEKCVGVDNKISFICM